MVFVYVDVSNVFFLQWFIGSIGNLSNIYVFDFCFKFVFEDGDYILMSIGWIILDNNFDNMGYMY